MSWHWAAIFCATSLAACSRTKSEMMSHQQAPSVTAGGLSTGAGQTHGGPMLTQGAQCSSRLAIGHETTATIPLAHASQLARVFEAAKRGELERVRVRAHNPMVMCDWPNFSITNFAKETYGAAQVIGGGGMFYAIFPQPLLDANKYKSLGEFGDAHYELTGFYSGRVIDALSWSRVQYNVPLRENCEDRSDVDTKYPEFCVESWCVRTNPGNTWKEKKLRDEYGRAYAKALEEARRNGVSMCSDAPR